MNLWAESCDPSLVQGGLGTILLQWESFLRRRSIGLRERLDVTSTDSGSNILHSMFPKSRICLMLWVYRNIRSTRVHAPTVLEPHKSVAFEIIRDKAFRSPSSDRFPRILRLADEQTSCRSRLGRIRNYYFGNRSDWAAFRHRVVPVLFVAIVIGLEVVQLVLLLLCGCRDCGIDPSIFWGHLSESIQECDEGGGVFFVMDWLRDDNADTVPPE